jgi:hypothetical protein
MKELDFLPPTFHQAIRRRRQMRQNVWMALGLAAAMAALHILDVTHVRPAEAAILAATAGFFFLIARPPQEVKSP